MATVGFFPIARPTFDLNLARSKVQAVQISLKQQYNLITPQALIMSKDDAALALDQLLSNDLDAIIVLQATFADTTLVQHIAQELKRPILLWALPEAHQGGRLRLNSFCGVNLAAHALRRAGLSYTYVYADPDDKDALAKIEQFVKASVVIKRLATTRIGRIGDHPQGFETCQYDATMLRSHLGIDVVTMPLERLFAQAQNTKEASISDAKNDLQQSLSNLDQVNSDEVDGTIKTFAALRQIAREQDIHGFAVRCWPEFFTEMGCAACGAMSMMSDRQVPCSCEADVNGTITQIILQELSGEPAFGSDIVSFDLNKDQAVVWHCGLAPLSMADVTYRPQAALHSNRQKALLMQFPLKSGRVTLARLSEASGELRLVIGSGEMLEAPPAFTGTSGTLRFDRGAQNTMDTLIDHGLEHHISLTYGDYVDELQMFAKLCQLPTLLL